MSARFAILTAGLLAFAVTPAHALELKNVRPSYGPLGATRTDMKFLPGDIMLVNFDIDGLTLDKQNKASYIVLLEVFKAGTKEPIYKKETPNVTIPQLGGSSIPTDFNVVMGIEHPPGQYTARLTVMDVLEKDAAAKVKSFTVPFELLAKGFGIVGIEAPTVAFLGHPYMFKSVLIDLGLDAAKKPNAKLELKIVDAAGKAVSQPIINEYPRDLPEHFDFKKANFIAIDLPIFPNRTGRFTIEITATDNSAAPRTATVRYPMTVLDVGTFSGSSK